MAGQDTTRGQRWSSRHPDRRKREERMAKEQAREERRLIMDGLRELAGANPGAVASVSTFLMADLSGESGHVQKVIVDGGTNIRGQPYRRVRVLYAQLGMASNVSSEVDGEWTPAGEMDPDDVHPAALGSYAEFIGLTGDGYQTPDELGDAVDRYISERWDPDWMDRDVVRGSWGEGDE